MTGSRFAVPEKALFYAAIFLCAIFALNSVAVQLAELPLHILKTGINEGWNAYFAARAMDGQPLYPRAPELIVNNYPPLSFYIVGLLGKCVGDYIIAGRIISFLSFLGIAAGLGIITAGRTGSRLTGAFAAAYFAAVFSVFPGERIGFDDPQLLAHAVMLAGFAIFWLGDGSFRAILAGAALMVIAGLIKHNLIALPLAVTLWLATSDRKQFRLWLAAAGLCLAAAAVVTITLWGGAFIQSMLTPRQTSLGRALHVIVLLREFLPSLTMLVFLLYFSKAETPRETENFHFSAIYVVVSLIMAFLVQQGAGVSSNSAFDVVISVVLAIGLRVGALPPGREKTAALAALVVGQYFMITTGLATVAQGIPAAAARQDGLDFAYLAAHSGKAVCGNPTLCFWGKKDFDFDFFNMDQLYALKKRDPEPFIAAIRRKDYAVIVREKAVDPFGEAWLAQYDKALEASYRMDRNSGPRSFYVPK